MELGLKDRVAVITGASRGIGFSAAADMLREGAHVVVVSLDPARNAEAVERLRADKPAGRVVGVACDLSSPEDVDALFATVEKEFGRLDILVNNAAVIAAEEFFSSTEDGWSSMFEHKLNGTARCIRHAVPMMRKRGWGRIINVSGTAAQQPTTRTISVALNNIGVLTVTKALAKELSREGINVTAVIPGQTLSERNRDKVSREAATSGRSEDEVAGALASHTPIGRWARPEEVSGVITFLASDRASFVTGTAWSVDGGLAGAL